MPKPLQYLLKFGLPLLLLAGAVIGTRALIKSRPEPQRQDKANLGMLVETAQPSPGQYEVAVRGRGNVVAARELRLQPEVAGRITWIHDRLLPGSTFKKGTTLLRIDPTDYRLNLDEQQSAVEQAEAQLLQEKGAQKVARREWELFAKEMPRDSNQGLDPALALRKPQLRIAEVGLKAAKTRAKRARVNLSRTTIRAPFNVIVRAESAELGQLVNIQSAVATLVGSDTFHVRANIPLEQIAHLKIPGINAKEGEGSQASITQDLGGKTIKRSGQVIRLISELDQVGRMAQLLIAVDDPLDLDDSEPGELPLLIGAYVDVHIEGGSMDGLIAIPRRAIHDGDSIHVMTPDNKLDIRSIGIVWNRPDNILTRARFAPGEQLVVSAIPSPVQGMKLRLASEPTPKNIRAQKTKKQPSTGAAP